MTEENKPVELEDNELKYVTGGVIPDGIPNLKGDTIAAPVGDGSAIGHDGPHRKPSRKKPTGMPPIPFIPENVPERHDL